MWDHVQQRLLSNRPTDAVPWHDGFGWMFFSWIAVDCCWGQVWTAFGTMNGSEGYNIGIHTCYKKDIAHDGSINSHLGSINMKSTWSMNVWQISGPKVLGINKVMLVESNEIFSFNLDWRLGSNLQSTDCIKSSVLLTRPGEVSNFTVDLETDEEGMVWKKISPCCIHYIHSKVLGVVLSWQVNLTPPPKVPPQK